MSAVEHRFGPYGGQYVPETLMPALAQLEAEWELAWADPAFRAELDALLGDYAGRPTPLYEARRLSEAAGRRILLKREDLLHTGAHKLNNALGQALLTRRMGKPRVIAETGAGQHGVATATSSTWAPRTCAARNPTCSACACSAPTWPRSRSVPARSRRRCPRRSATGLPTWRRPTT